MNAIMRIALLHLENRSGDVSFNHRQIRKGLALAAGYEADVAITAELAESGEDFFRYVKVETIPNIVSPFVQDLRQVAMKYKMHIILGRPQREVNVGAIYNALTHINSCGQIQANYQKQTDSYYIGSNLFSVGNQGCITEILGCQVGLMIGDDFCDSIIKSYECYDVDLLFLALSGEEIVDLLKKHPGMCKSPLFACNDIAYHVSSQENSIAERESFCKDGMGYIEVFSCYRSQVIILDYNIESRQIQLVNRVRI